MSNQDVIKIAIDDLYTFSPVDLQCMAEKYLSPRDQKLPHRQAITKIAEAIHGRRANFDSGKVAQLRGQLSNLTNSLKDINDALANRLSFLNSELAKDPLQMNDQEIEHTFELLVAAESCFNKRDLLRAAKQVEMSMNKLISAPQLVPQSASQSASPSSSMVTPTASPPSTPMVTPFATPMVTPFATPMSRKSIYSTPSVKSPVPLVPSGLFGEESDQAFTDLLGFECQTDEDCDNKYGARSKKMFPRQKVICTTRNKKNDCSLTPVDDMLLDKHQ